MRTAHVNQTAQPGPPDRPSGAVPAARARLCGVASLLAAVAITLAWVGGAGASVADPPGAVLARYQGGAQVSDGVRTVTVSQSAELQPGQSIAVNGVGFDVDKGVYVGLCLVPPAGAVPSPCAGGEDRSGSSGASAWFSSNPPSYATNIAVPYAQGGSFSAQLTVSPELGGGLDCRQVQCAIATRNDHTRSTDRSQDLYIPVTFAAGAPAEAPQPTEAPVVPAPPVEEPVQATIAEAPVTPAPAVEDKAATTRPKATTTAKPKKKSTTTVPKTTTTTTKPKATTTSAKPTTTTAPERAEEPKITVSSNDGGSGGWGWGLAAAGGVALLGGAGAGIYRSKTGRWPGMNAPTDGASAP